MRLADMDDPGFLLPDWVVTRPRLTGICGSDSKQVFGDWGEVQSPDNPMKAWFSLPQVLGHEVVADVVALGPEAQDLDVGDRVVLNPWLSCAPRGVSPVCPACERGDLSLCWSYAVGPIAPGIHTGTSKDASGGYATLMPAHDSMLFKVPDAVPDELAVFSDPFAVSLHAVTRNPPPPGGRAMVYGAGALGTCATAILRALHPDTEVLVVARFDAQAEMARRLGATAIAARARDPGDRGGRGLVRRRAPARRRAADGVSRRHRRRVRHRGQARDVRGRQRASRRRAAASSRRVFTAPRTGRTLRSTSRSSPSWARTRSASRTWTVCASTASRTTSSSCATAVSTSRAC